MRLALWQGAGVAGDLDGTLAEVARVADMARQRNADFLVFPEGYLTGYYLPGLVRGGLPGVEQALAAVAAIAKRHKLAIAMGTHIETTDGLSNAAVVIDASGTELGRYAKRALFGDWERQTFQPGREPLRFQCGGLTVGVAICYDVEFPELMRAEALANVDLVIVPTALMAPHDRIAQLLVPTRAMENQIAIGYANRVGQEGPYDFVGLSSIRGPQGEPLATAGAEAQLLVADIDRQTILNERAAGSYLEALAQLRASFRPRDPALT